MKERGKRMGNIRGQGRIFAGQKSGADGCSEKKGVILIKKTKGGKQGKTNYFYTENDIRLFDLQTRVFSTARKYSKLQWEQKQLMPDLC